jgi:putative membrane protein
MTEFTAPDGTTTTLPPQSANGQLPEAPQPPKPRTVHTRLSGVHTSLIAGGLGLIVVMIFIIQNAHAVSISFLGAHLHLSLAVALLLAAIAGGLLMAAAGTARITQLRRIIRRDRRAPKTS